MHRVFVDVFGVAKEARVGEDAAKALGVVLNPSGFEAEELARAAGDRLRLVRDLGVQLWEGETVTLHGHPVASPASD
jgi:hypothetical protein